MKEENGKDLNEVYVKRLAEKLVNAIEDFQRDLLLNCNDIFKKVAIRDSYQLILNLKEKVKVFFSFT